MNDFYLLKDIQFLIPYMHVKLRQSHLLHPVYIIYLLNSTKKNWNKNKSFIITVYNLLYIHKILNEQ